MKDAHRPMHRRTALTTLVSAGALALSGAAVMTAPAGRATSAAPRRVLFGAWVPGGAAAAAAIERQLGRTLDIEHWYQGWGADDNAFDLERAGQVASRGGIPMVTWEPWDYRAGQDQPAYALRRIARGRFDQYIRENARQMAKVPRPVWLRFAHEMNGQAYPWSIGVNGNTGRHYIAAWRRIVRIFREEGASNVRFVWCPLVPSPGTTRLQLCFPGDAYVSFVGMDGYNAGSEADWGGWLSFTQVFGPLYRQLRRLSRRPVIIAETGCAEGGGSKSAWIRSAFLRQLPDRFPAVRAVVWFNERREADWRLESSDESITAARRVFRSGPFA